MRTSPPQEKEICSATPSSTVRPGIFLGTDPEGPFHSPLDFRRFHRLELKDGTPAEHRIVDIEIGVFSGGGNKGDAAVLNEFQQILLLFFIEVLDLVQIEYNTIASFKGIQLADNLLDVCRGSCGTVEPVELFAGLIGNDIGNGGLSHTRWPIEDHIGNGAAFNDAAQHLSLGQQMGLSHHIFQRPGTQFIGKR